MQFKRYYGIVLLLLLGVVAALVFFFFSHKPPATPSELVAMLPRSEAVLAFIDVKALRYSGLLERIAGSKTAEEPEYKNFIQETGFDYRRDIDRIAAAFRNGHAYFVIQGNFHWKRLSDYAEQHGGRCSHRFCQIPGSKPDRKVSFLEVQSGVLGVAVSNDENAASELAPRPQAPLMDMPPQPVWVQLPHAVLANPETLPAGASSIVKALSLADKAIFSLSNEASNQKELKLVLHLDARFDSNLKAEMVQKQLETITELLKRLLAEEKKDPNPGDLSGLLAAGTFRQNADQVLGQWPVQKELVDALLQ